MHSFKNKKKPKMMGLKLDLAKAYDCMEWDFLHKTLNAFGVNDNFIQLLKECIFSVSYSILLNGSPFGNFYTSRGLRQGDAVHPYLFILGVEVLSRMLTKAKDMGTIQRIRVARGAPSVSHLFFADDSFSFL